MVKLTFELSTKEKTPVYDFSENKKEIETQKVQQNSDLGETATGFKDNPVEKNQNNKKELLSSKKCDTAKQVPASTSKIGKFT